MGLQTRTYQPLDLSHYKKTQTSKQHYSFNQANVALRLVLSLWLDILHNHFDCEELQNILFLFSQQKHFTPALLNTLPALFCEESMTWAGTKKKGESFWVPPQKIFKHKCYLIIHCKSEYTSHIGRSCYFNFQYVLQYLKQISCQQK